MEYTTTLTGTGPTVITIGNFDGIHRGHQRLMQELREMAQELQCIPVLVTFEPHTLMVVRPDIDLQLLTSLEEKLELARIYGQIDESVVIHFTPEVVAMSADDFLEELRTRFAVRGMVVGANFSLGHNRMGDISFLKQYGQKHNIAVRPIELEEIEYTRISSTRIRAFVAEGNIAEAKELLGHPVMCSGIVAHGDRRGRLLGFPTANLVLEPHKLIPANGVYAAWVGVGEKGVEGAERASSDGVPFPPVYTDVDTPEGAFATSRYQETYKGVVNIGVRPTFDGQKRLVEAHLLDVEDIDLYDQRITLNFLARLRDEQRFAGVEALKKQIAMDVQTARELFSEER